MSHRFFWWALAGGLLVGAPVASAQNFPPVARATAAPLEALVGEDVSFSSAMSLDPDMGPMALSFLWDFGDGNMSTAANPTHAYDAAGFYPVTLTVSDGAAMTLAGLEIAVLAPPTAQPPTNSSAIVLSEDEATVWVVNADSNSVSAIDTAALTVRELDVCGEPRALALSTDGTTLYVSCKRDDAVVLVDTATVTVSTTVPVGRAPHGVAVAPDGRVLVANEGDGSLSVLEADGTPSSTVELGGTPRALAITADGATAYVTHFLTRGDTGAVSVVDLGALTAGASVALVEDPGPDTASSGRGFPNLLGAIAIHPSGDAVWVGGIKHNTGRGPVLNGENLAPRNRLRGVLAPIDVAGGSEILDERIDTNDADSVTGVVFSPRGRYAYLLHQGAGRLSIYDLPKVDLVSRGDGDVLPFESRIDLGHAPQGIVLTADGTRAYVTNYLSRDVMVIDVTDPTDPAVTDTVAVTEEPLEPEIALGKRLFYRSTEPVHSDQNYIACASCHPDGSHDGRTWDFTQFGEGLRNTIDLRGRAGTGHGPVHWSANFDEIQDFENDIVNGFGGTGLADDGMPPHPPLSMERNGGRSEDLDALAAYVASLTDFPSSPHRADDGSLSDAALRGRDLFFDDSVGCATCHAPPRFTDSTLTPDPADFVRYDVGTIQATSGGHLGGELTGIDTPTVIGVWATPPYLHDGSAATLRDVLTTRNPDDLHGSTSQLSSAQIDDLVEFLLSLQGSPDELPGGVLPDGGVAPDAGVPPTDGGAPPPPPGDDDGCGCVTPGGSPAAPWPLVLVALVFLRLRRLDAR